jgi:hypothetical protein
MLCVFAAAHAGGQITQEWFMDAQCSQGENIVKVNEGQCYLDSVDYSGLSWHCDGGSVVAWVYSPGNTNCNGQPVAKKTFPPNKCMGPVYNNLYLIASGC